MRLNTQIETPVIHQATHLDAEKPRPLRDPIRPRTRYASDVGPMAVAIPVFVVVSRIENIRGPALELYMFCVDSRVDYVRARTCTC